MRDQTRVRTAQLGGKQRGSWLLELVQCQSSGCLQAEPLMAKGS